MNTTPRYPLPRYTYSARLNWPDVMGGYSEVIGPFDHSRDLERSVRAIKDNLGPSVWPSITRFSTPV